MVSQLARQYAFVMCVGCQITLDNTGVAPIQRTPWEEVTLPCVSPKLARKVQRRNRYSDEVKMPALRPAVQDREDRTIVEGAESLGIGAHLPRA